MGVKISVSIMAGNFTQDAVDRVASADMIHIDVMDGEFVPNKSVWAEFISELDTELIKEVHLMIMNPEEYVEEFITAGADRISFHIEATDVPESIIGTLQAAGVKAGITINPETAIEEIDDLLGEVDYVLVMSVHPGKGGQSFITEVLDKVKYIKLKQPNLEVEIDGGIDGKTAKKVIKAGVDILVSGTFIYSGDSKKNIRELRKPS